MKRARLLLPLTLALLLLASACDALSPAPATPAEPPAATMLPDLPGYNVVEGQTLTDYLNTVAGGAALLAGQPELAAVVAVVDEIGGCYQDVGAARARLYSNADAPLTAGAVAIADRNELLDPANFFQCAVPQLRPQTGDQAGAIEPCGTSYTLEQEDNAFYIAYAGTRPEICRAFCAQLPECTAHE